MLHTTLHCMVCIMITHRSLSLSCVCVTFRNAARYKCKNQISGHRRRRKHDDRRSYRPLHTGGPKIDIETVIEGREHPGPVGDGPRGHRRWCAAPCRSQPSVSSLWTRTHCMNVPRIRNCGASACGLVRDLIVSHVSHCDVSLRNGVRRQSPVPASC